MADKGLTDEELQAKIQGWKASGAWTPEMEAGMQANNKKAQEQFRPEPEDTRSLPSQMIQGGAKRGMSHFMALGGAARTVAGAIPGAQLEEDPLSKIARAGRPSEGYPEPFKLFSPEGRKMMYEPKGGGEELGALGVDVAESFVPGMGGVAKTARMFPRGYQTAARMIGEGTAAGAQAAMRDEPVGVATGVGAAMPAVMAPVGAVASKASPALRRKAENVYGRVFAPRTDAERDVAKKVTPHFLDRGDIFFTRRQLGTHAGTKARNLAESKAREIHRLSGGSGPDNVLLEFGPIAQSIDNLTQERLMTTGKATGAGVFRNPRIGKKAAKELESFKKAMQDVTHIDPVTGQRVIAYSNLEDFKDNWQSFLRAMGRYEGKDIKTHAIAQAADIGSIAIMEEFKQATPNISNIDKKLSFWTNVKNAVGGKEEREFGRPGSGASRVVMGGSQGKFGSRLVRTRSYSLAMKMLEQTLNSPGWATIPAVTMNKLSKALATGQFDKVTSVLSRLGAQIASQPTDENYPMPAAGETGPTGEEPIKWTPGMTLPE